MTEVLSSGRMIVQFLQSEPPLAIICGLFTHSVVHPHGDSFFLVLLRGMWYTPLMVPTCTLHHPDFVSLYSGFFTLIVALYYT